MLAARPNSSTNYQRKSSFPNLLAGEEKPNAAEKFKEFIKILKYVSGYADSSYCTADEESRERIKAKLVEFSKDMKDVENEIEEATENMQDCKIETGMAEDSSVEAKSDGREEMAEAIRKDKQRVEDQFWEGTTPEQRTEILDELTKSDLICKARERMAYDENCCIIENLNWYMEFQCETNEAAAEAHTETDTVIGRRMRYMDVCRDSDLDELRHKRKLIMCGLDSLSSEFCEGESRLALQYELIQDDIKLAKMLASVVKMRRDYQELCLKLEKGRQDELKWRLKATLHEKKMKRGAIKKPQH